MARSARSPLKAVLLDQGAFPGIGNWMADEILWRCRLHPAIPAGRLAATDVARLRKEIRHVAREALRIIAPDWTDPPETWLFRHRWKDGGHCPRRGCGAGLRRETVRGRTTCWCPACQKPPTG
jgi:formamidopyrimidine-DNA glycosylase